MNARLLFATGNPSKLEEISKFAAEYQINIISPAEMGISAEVDETGSTFEENAKIKAEHALEQISDPNLWVAADDSGIMIDALDGEPGVHTRRWNGTTMSDQEIIDYALDKLNGVDLENRTAHFLSVVAFGRLNLPIRYSQSRLNGVITEKPNPNVIKREGFPFRTIFKVTKSGQMLGEGKGKNSLTHRQKAFLEVFEFIK